MLGICSWWIECEESDKSLYDAYWCSAAMSSKGRIRVGNVNGVL